MDNNNNHISYTAADIEKYHKGLLSRSEMHAMEKAAMDDPFLSDAIEGYASAGTNVTGDINQIKERLAERLEGAKVVPIHKTTRSRSLILLKVAAVLAFIASAGLLIYQFGTTNKDNNIATAEPKQTAEPDKLLDSSTAVITNEVSPDSIPAVAEKTTSAPKEAPAPTTGNANISPVEKTVPEKDIATNKTTTEKPAVVKNDEVVAAPSRTRSFDLEEENKKTRQTDSKSAPVSDGRVAKDKVADGKKLSKENTYNPGIVSSRNPENYQSNNYTFRGQVTDNRNRAVPFANVISLSRDDSRTYTDSKGYFNFTHPDSVVNVEVRSVGYEKTNVQLRNYIDNQRVVLNEEEDKTVMRKSEVGAVSTIKTTNAKKSETSEPEDGWEKYQVYMLNNLEVPADFKVKPAGAAVVLSFEVNKSGTPMDIQIEKSLCASCDREAIRLLKEGPKWKRKSKKSRTTITIPF